MTKSTKSDLINKVRNRTLYMSNILSSEILRQFNINSWELDSLYHEISLMFNLNDSELNILYLLSYYGGSSPLRDICRYGGKSKQTINSALRKMEKEGLLYLEKSNGNNKTIFLTDKGKERARNSVDLLIKAEDEILKSIEPELCLSFIKALGIFKESLKEKKKCFKISDFIDPPDEENSSNI